MLVDLKKLEPVGDLADRELPEIGLPAQSYQSLYRDIRKGTKSRSGEVVRLWAVRLNGKLHTSRQHILDYLKASAAADTAFFAHRDEGASLDPSPAMPRPRLRRSRRRRRADVDRAECEARELGL